MCACVNAKSLQSCPTLCDYGLSLPGFSVHGILQARILEWVVMPSSRGSSRPRDRTQISCSSFTAGVFFTAEPPGKPSIAVWCFPIVFSGLQAGIRSKAGFILDWDLAKEEQREKVKKLNSHKEIGQL